MRALVTGGAGFIGSALVERLLAGGDEVDVVDDLSSGSIGRLAGARGLGRSFRFHQIDVCAPDLVDLLERRRPEVVFHLAARAADGAVHDVARDAEVGVVGTLRVLEGARRAGTAKLVYAASAELAATARRPAVARVAAVGPHGRAERAALDYLHYYRERFGLEFTALAFGCVYGPAHADAGPVAAIARSVAEGRPCELDGERSYDLVYLDDAVDALVRAGARGSGLVVSVGSGEATSAAALVEVMSTIAGTEVPVAGRASAGGRAASSLDISRARLHLGWAPFTGLEEGLTAVLAEWLTPADEPVGR